MRTTLSGDAERRQNESLSLLFDKVCFLFKNILTKMHCFYNGI